MILYQVVMEQYESITYIFLVSDYNFMPCDQDFAIIEKWKQLTSALVPSEIKDVVRGAEQERLLKIIDIEKTHFYDLKNLVSELLNTTKLDISSVIALTSRLSYLISE